MNVRVSDQRLYLSGDVEEIREAAERFRAMPGIRKVDVVVTAANETHAAHADAVVSVDA